MALKEIYSRLVGKSNAGVAVFGQYPYQGDPQDSGVRVKTVVDAHIQGAWRTEFTQVSGKVYFASIFADETAADKFKSTLIDNKNICILQNL